MHPIIGLGLIAAAAWALFSEDKDSKMPAVQKQFDDFHANIKLDEDDEKANLREKRDTLLKALTANLPKDVPAFETFHQGSYSMHTGVVPLDGNYDIDVGIVFDCKRDKYPDPVELKKKVRDALNSNVRTVLIRRPCVTVNYMLNGEPQYHVDLALYAKRDDGMLDLAKGKEHSEAAHRVWELSDPKQLTELIRSRFKDEDVAQYRRCIRYSKRWRDVQFNGGAPLSIALTVAAYRWFRPYKTTMGTYIDLHAMRDWVDAMLNNFELRITDGSLYPRLRVELPVAPNVDLMAWMTKAQMGYFKGTLESLRAALTETYAQALPEDACKILVKQFGDDFPVPAKSETAKAVGAPFVHTGSSA